MELIRGTLELLLAGFHPTHHFWQFVEPIEHVQVFECVVNGLGRLLGVGERVIQRKQRRETYKSEFSEVEHAIGRFGAHFVDKC